MTPGKPTSDHLPDWFGELLAGRDFALGWKDGIADPEAWRQRGREAFQRCLLEEPGPEDAQAQWGRSEQRLGYRVHQLELTLGRYRRTPALLAIPDGPGPFPAVLGLHDHGAHFSIGKEKLIRPLEGSAAAPDAEAWVAANYGGRFVGDLLAQQGWTVLATDAYGWGDRTCAGYEAQQALASNLLGLGSSWAWLIATEDANAARWLAGLPGVDAERVAAVGHSMGAVRAWQVHALCDQVRACAAICSFGTLAGLMVPGGNRVRGQSAFSMTHPGLARLLDFPDLAGLAAPKPLLMLHGLDDRLFPRATVAEAYEKTRQIYQGLGNPGAFRPEWKHGGHVFSTEDQDRVVQWLVKDLGWPTKSSLLS